MKTATLKLSDITEVNRENFWKKVDKNGPEHSDASLGKCWIWTGALFGNGYGHFAVCDGKKHTGAHRFAFTICRGDIPSGMLLLHSCNNPECCNPLHLSVGNALDNKRDEIRTRGENGYSHKISSDDVRNIRAIFAKGGITKVALGRQFGVSNVMIQNVVTRRSWRHIE